ncbi:phage tail protein [Pseudomonas mosselii]|uniref:phage tail protein n=1 Tax=Pseudomonas TaxID=286 RepID=UPI001117EE84|nr:phage tail protein [Pseudomonas sp. F16(2018)]
MVDQNSQFYAILTNVGAAKQANADALGIPWKITQMGVGDANGTDPTPNATQTSLISEWRRAPLNQLKVDDKNNAIIIAEQVIPADVGGKWIREIALYDIDGDMVAVANCAPTYKPLLSQGSGRTQVVRMNLIVSSSSNVQLRIDPSVVLATREYVDSKILEVLPAGRPAGTYTKVTISERGIVTAGANPTTLAGYGITDALKKGYLGLGGKTAPAGAIDTIGLEGGFYSYTDGETTFGNYASVLNIPYITNDYSAQLGFKYSGEEPIIIVRSAKASGQWGRTRVLWHSGNFDPSGYISVANGYTRPQVDGMLASKANWAITLGGYGITDAYTKSEVNTALLAKADKDKALAVGVVSRQQPVVASPTSGSEYGSGALIIREAQEVGATDGREIFAPGIGFHWLGQVAGKLVMDSIGRLKWNGQPLLMGTTASQGEVDTGSTDTGFVTPLKLRWGFSFIKGGGGANNAVVFPTWLGGLMIQWGVHIANAADAETTVTFPLGFNIIPACVSGFTHDGVMTQSTVTPQARLLTATGFQSRREDVINSSSFSGTAYIRWIAVGY